MSELERAILELLAAQLLPLLGVEIVERSKGTIGQAGLHAHLGKLEQKGLVRCETHYHTVGNRLTMPRLMYTITERGRRLHQGVA